MSGIVKIDEERPRVASLQDVAVDTVYDSDFSRALRRLCLALVIVDFLVLGSAFCASARAFAATLAWSLRARLCFVSA